CTYIYERTNAYVICSCDNFTCTIFACSYTCGCPEGTFGDGTFCNTEDFCGDETLNTCGENSICMPVDGSFVCDCNEGFEDVDGMIGSAAGRAKADLNVGTATAS